jgi:hypothetical protein
MTAVVSCYSSYSEPASHLSKNRNRKALKDRQQAGDGSSPAEIGAFDLQHKRENNGQYTAECNQRKAAMPVLRYLVRLDGNGSDDDADDSAGHFQILLCCFAPLSAFNLLFLNGSGLLLCHDIGAWAGTLSKPAGRTGGPSDDRQNGGTSGRISG